MFQAEERALTLIKDNFQGICPEVLFCGFTPGYAFLLMEWIERTEANSGDWKHFGRQMALLHSVSRDSFGFDEDNFIGTLPQFNPRSDSWETFFIENRIRPQMQMLTTSGRLHTKEMLLIDQLADAITGVFPMEPPSLLHGDLWSGNCMPTRRGFALYDSAPYFGHREMDIGMTLLFGGFPAEFYAGYEEIYSLEPGWRDRLSLAQLYPILVHANLFGGVYVNHSLDILSSWSG